MTTLFKSLSYFVQIHAIMKNPITQKIGFSKIYHLNFLEGFRFYGLEPDKRLLQECYTQMARTVAIFQFAQKDPFVTVLLETMTNHFQDLQKTH